MTILLLLSAGACSGQAAPTAQPSQASMDPEEVQALVQAAVEAAITESATGSGEEISRQELRDLVAEAIAETPPVASQGDFAELVSEAIKQELAARPASISQTDVERIIQREMAGSQEAVGVTPKPAAKIGKPTSAELKGTGSVSVFTLSCMTPGSKGLPMLAASLILDVGCLSNSYGNIFPSLAWDNPRLKARRCQGTEGQLDESSLKWFRVGRGEHFHFSGRLETLLNRVIGVI